MESFAETVAPIVSLFSASQIESLLYAFLPLRLEAYKTGIYAIDTFMVTASVTVLIVLFKWIILIMSSMRQKNELMSPKEISVLVDPMHQDDYHSSMYAYFLYVKKKVENNSFFGSTKYLSSGTLSFNFYSCTRE